MAKVPTNDPERILEVHQQLVERLRTNPEVASVMEGEIATIGIHLTEPDINLRLSLNGADSSLVRILEGDDKEDDVKISMKWETAHKFWLGQVDIMRALLTGKIKITGPNMDPLFRLKSIAQFACQTYQEITKEMG